MRIKFITVYDEDMKDNADLLLSTLVMAKGNNNTIINYEKYLVKKESRHTSWAKLNYMLMEAAEWTYFYDWIFCIDADSFVANLNYDFSFLKNETKGFLISYDWNGPCAAAMAIKPDSFGCDIIKILMTLGDIKLDKNDEFGVGLGPKQEQNSLKVLMKYFNSIESNVGKLPDDFILDNPDVNKPLPFLYHYAAARKVSEKNQLMKDAYAKFFPKILENLT